MRKALITAHLPQSDGAQSYEAQEAIADHERTQKEFHEDRNRFREERLTREAAARPIFFQSQNFQTTRLSTTSNLVAESEMHSTPRA